MVERSNGLRSVVEWQRCWVPLGQHLVSWSEYSVSRVVYKFYRKLSELLGLIQSILEKVSRKFFVGRISECSPVMFNLQVLGGSSRDWRKSPRLGLLDMEGVCLCLLLSICITDMPVCTGRKC